MAFLRYIRRYRMRDMIEIIRNDRRGPLPCGETLTGRTVVLSGATSGIGLETAHLFAEKGARLVLLNRNPEKSRKLVEELENRYRASVRTIIADFSSLADTRRCAQDLQELPWPIDMLIHNSGVFYTKKTLTPDGHEIVFQVNHLSSFLLTYLLREKLKDENRARVLYVNSEGHRFALGGVHLKDLHWKRHRYTGLKSYGAAKTAQLLTMRRFNDVFAETKVTVNAMHPGNVRSSIGENNGRAYRFIKKHLVMSSAKDPQLSAQVLLYLAASKNLENRSGEFFNLTSPEKPAPHARDEAAVEAVWNISLELCGLAR